MKSGDSGTTNIPIFSDIQEFDKNLPNTVELLQSKDGDKIYVVGTAHFSRKSQDDVSLVMRNTNPHAVVLELCPLRVHILRLDEKKLLEEAASINPEKVKQIFNEHGVSGGMFYLSFLNMSANITKQLGVAPGGECRRAVEEAKQLPDCKVMLGDRPINITMKRAMSGLTFGQKLKLSYYLNSSVSNTTISEADVEKYKDRSLQPMDGLRRELPSIYRAFVTERDIILAHSMLMASQVIKDLNDTRDPTRIVGVVGMGHMNGISKNFGKTTINQVQQLMTIPQNKWYNPANTPMIWSMATSTLTNPVLRRIFKLPK